MTEIASLILLPFLLANATASGYLMTLALASLARRHTQPKAQAEPAHITVIVPAHNEEVLLPKLLTSLLQQDYPRHRYTVHVIADNCRDATAEVARQTDVVVHERFDPTALGKGHALRWLLDQLKTEAPVDAYAFLDADSVVDANFLTAMNDRMAGGATAIQASYRVSDPSSHALVGLRALSFALMHDVRGAGKQRLGLSCGLWGNGMLLSRDLVNLISWGGFSAVEDAEQHLQLLLQGSTVDYLADTHVYGFMPSTFRGSKDQQTRWEGGKQSLLRNYWRRLLVAVVTTRSPLPAAALLELAIPPASVQVMLSCVFVIVSLWLGGVFAVLALAGLAALGIYFVVGLLSAGLPLKVYLSLLYAPPYVLWKAWLFGCQLPKRVGPAWLPTSRDG